MSETSNPALSAARIFSPDERQALYDIIQHRRDVRDEFLSTPIDPDALRRVLKAAHAAPVRRVITTLEFHFDRRRSNPQSDESRLYKGQ